MPLPTICTRAERSAADGIAASGPATDPIWIQVSDALRSARAVSRSTSACAVGWQLGQSHLVAAGGDHAPRTEALGDLDGHPAGVPGRPEDQHPLPAAEVDAPAQRDRRRHHGVHRRRHQDRIGAVREDDAAIELDHGALGEGSEGAVGEHRIAEATLGSRTTASMPGTSGSRPVLV
jgi:hypothetical protein